MISGENVMSESNKKPLVSICSGAYSFNYLFEVLSLTKCDVVVIDHFDKTKYVDFSYTINNTYNFKFIIVINSETKQFMPMIVPIFCKRSVKGMYFQRLCEEIQEFLDKYGLKDSANKLAFQCCLVVGWD